MPRLTDKVAVVTGGTGGLGRVAAEWFVAEGARVVIADVDSERGPALAQRLGDAAVFQATDVADVNSLKALVARAVSEFGGLHVMFNNAAIASAMHTSLFDEDFSDFERVMQVNLLGVMLGTQCAARHMAAHGGGSIINTSATSGILAGYALPCYRTAKAAVNHFTKSAAIDFGAYNVRVNAIAPGNISTEMNAFTTTGMDAEKQREWDAVRNRIRMAPQPLKREGTAVDVAEAAVFLASEESAQITGVVLPVDGGITINHDIGADAF